MEIIADVTEVSTINAPVDDINVTEWLFTLSEHEYRACSKGHIACGNTFAENGKRMSINVEMIADNLLIQHYIEEIGEPSHCRVASISDSFAGLGRTKLGIVWELKIFEKSDAVSTFSNRVMVLMTDDFEKLLSQAGITSLDNIKTLMAENAGAHNKEETPLFAKDIERKALAKRWATL